MTLLKSPSPLKYLRAALMSALASVTLLGGSALAQRAPTPEEPVYEEEILDEGNAWQLKSIRGTALDDKSQTYQPYEETLFTLQKDGIAEAPLAGGIQDLLLADATRDPQSVYILNKRILEEIDISRRQGYLTPALQALAEADDGMPNKLPSCSDQIQTRSKTLSANTPINLSQNFGSGFSGSLSVTGNLQASATGEVQFTVKRFWLFGCIPYAVRFNHVHAYGSATVGTGTDLNGTLNYNYAWETQLAKLPLGGIAFFIGPVPVFIGFNLPINLGLDVQATVTGNLHYAGTQSATANFDYTCSLISCSGSTNYNLPTNQQQPLTGSVSGHVYPNVWVQAAVRGFLYTEWVAYAQIGVRPYLRGDLWGYYGNSCGDADGDGLNETVDALTFDLDWQLYLTGQASAFGSTPTQWNNLWSTPRYHIKFWDLIGSDAIRPMISGSPIAMATVSQPYSGQMRPCWPYNDNVTYRFAWGDASTTTFNGAAHSWNASSHTWATPGLKTISLSAMSDTHGRTFTNKFTNLKLEVWTPWLNRDGPSGAGDYETLADFVAAGQVCSNPLAIQCQTTTGVPWNQTGQVYSCSLPTGGVCSNNSQTCLNYQVRFLCP